MSYSPTAVPLVKTRMEDGQHLLLHVAATRVERINQPGKRWEQLWCLVSLEDVKAKNIVDICRCEASAGYNHRLCVRASLARKVGCSLEGDRAAPPTLPPCSTTHQLRQYKGSALIRVCKNTKLSLRSFIQNFYSV